MRTGFRIRKLQHNRPYIFLSTKYYEWKDESKS